MRESRFNWLKVLVVVTGVWGVWLGYGLALLAIMLVYYVLFRILPI